MKYNNNLKVIREQNTLTQNDIANILGVDRTVYTKYENGYELIPIKHLLTFCNYFLVSVDYIFGLSTFKNDIKFQKEINLDLIGSRLKEFRKKHKLTQEKLAKILNTNKSVLCNYEKGRYLIATPFLYQICHKHASQSHKQKLL